MSSPDINYPAQPTYGEGMADAMKAQMEQLLGQGEYAQMYADAGFAGGNLGDVIRGVEAPIRQQTAQTDTDVLRQTLLGTQTKVVKDPETGKYGIPGAEVVKSSGSSDSDDFSGRYQLLKVHGTKQTKQEFGNPNYGYFAEPKYQVIDTLTGGVTATVGGEGYYVTSGGKVAKDDGKFNYGNYTPKGNEGILKEVSAKFQELNRVLEESGEDAVVEQFEFTNPNTGEPLREGEVVREGDGMIDLLGDKRNVMEVGQVDDFEAYVDNNPDLVAEYNRKVSQGYDGSKADFGKGHYDAFGKSEGRELTQKTDLVDTGRMAGFDADGNFLGLSVLAEDIQRGNLSRQREADLADVELLSDRFQDVMADYKPETAAALTDAGDILKEQKNTLTGGGAITVPTDSTYGGDITASTMQAAKVADPLQLSANTQFGGDLATGKTSTGEDTLRSALLGDARTALGQGLTEREQANIANAARARQTMMGRTFDQSGAIAEAEARVAEDNARRMQNRAFAQGVLGQEAGIQQGDITRGMAQESEQAGLQQRADLTQAQMDQQANAFDADAAMRASQVNQAQQQQANQFGVGATMDAQRLNEQLKQSGTLGYVDAATRLAALEDQQTLDPFQALLGRGGGNSLQAGQGVFGQAGYGLQSGPQYLNPEAGLGYISQMAANDANMAAAEVSAKGSMMAGLFGGLGSLGGGLLQNPKLCWVAREVYGETNPSWMLFREWLIDDSPSWFRNLYIKYGERFANWISDKPRIKSIIRKWMDSKIGGK